MRDSHSGALRTEDRPDGWRPPRFYSPEGAQIDALIDLCHPVYLTAYVPGATGGRERDLRPHDHPDGFGGCPGAGEGGPDGKLHIRSDNLAGVERQWLVRELPAALPPAFDEWVTHIQRGTRATENIALALHLTAIVEAATRGAATGQRMRLDGLERGV